jgi:multidrug efflux pump subunit AcrB
VRGLISWFASNGVVANLLMAGLLVAGLMTVPTIKKEVMPEFEVDLVMVQVPYLGAAPEEVEEGVLIRVEEAVQGLDGIKRITSTANEGMGTVNIEVESGWDAREVLDDVKNRIDAIETFPKETERPIITQPLIRRQVINVSVAGETDDRTLRKLGEKVRDDLLALDGISQADLKYARPYEIAIEVSENELRRHGLSLDQVAAAVRRTSLDLPGGALRTDSGEILLRTLGQAYVGREFEDLTLLRRADGTKLKISDIGRVTDGFEENSKWANFDGKPTVLVEVYRVGEENALDVAATVKGYIEEAGPSMPEGISLTVWRDSSEILQDRIDLLTRNGLTGLALVFIVLALFLRLRLAFWVSLGIPISFLGAIALLPMFDVSINMLSLFAFILVLGIVVDDAIVVGESIFSEQEKHSDGRLASVRGTNRVSIPVIFGVLTTMVAFTPMLFMEGTIRNFARMIPVVVLSCLFFSLVESQLILPNHLSHSKQRKRSSHILMRLWDGFFDIFRNGLQFFIRKVYRPVLNVALRWRYLTASVALVTLMLTMGAVAAGKVQFVFMTMDESNDVSVSLTLPLQTPASVTGPEIEKIERTVMQFREDLERETGEKIFRHVLSSVGEAASSPFGGPGAAPVRSSPYVGGVMMELVPSEQRSMSAEQVANRLRERIQPVPGAVELAVKSGGFGGNAAINVQFIGRDVEELRLAATEMKSQLGTYSGVVNITDSFRGGKPEIKLDVTSRGESLGVSLEHLGRQVRQGFYGEQAQRIQRDRDDIRVMVRYPAEERNNIADLENMRIRTPSGDEVPFSSVARAEMGRGYASIKRVDRQRSINVTSDVDEAVANANEVLADLDVGFMPTLQERFPGIRYSYEGEQEDQRDFMDGMSNGFIYVILIIYAMLAIPFRSYIQPVLVLSAVPFGIVGAIWGHAIMGYTMTALSLMGVIAVAGVVVNDSLVLVSFVNDQRQTGMKAIDVVREAAQKRFRPIMLTSLTTAAGIAPLMLERSVQARFLIPMAISLAFGVLFATVITLVIVPAGYLIIEDFMNFGRWLRGKPSENMKLDVVEPNEKPEPVGVATMPEPDDTLSVAG